VRSLGFPDAGLGRRQFELLEEVFCYGTPRRHIVWTIVFSSDLVDYGLLAKFSL
jgi:hypothetical protein